MRAVANQYGDVVLAAERDEGLNDTNVQQSIEDVVRTATRGVVLHARGPEQQALIVPRALRAGFRIFSHQADLVTLRYWSLKDRSDPIAVPPFTATSAMGLVIDAQGRALFVRHSSNTDPTWMLPGGFVDPGESVAEAAAREVLEETGIVTEPVALIAIRDAPRYQTPFWLGSLQFVFLLRPATGASLDLRPDPSEIREARWIEQDEWERDDFPVWDLIPPALRGAAAAHAVRLGEQVPSSEAGIAMGIGAGLQNAREGPFTVYIPTSVARGADALLGPALPALPSHQSASQSRTDDRLDVPPAWPYMQPTAAQARGQPPRWARITRAAIVAGLEDSASVVRPTAGARVGRLGLPTLAVVAGVAFGFVMGSLRAQRLAGAPT